MKYLYLQVYMKKECDLDEISNLQHQDLTNKIFQSKIQDFFVSLTILCVNKIIQISKVYIIAIKFF